MKAADVTIKAVNKVVAKKIPVKKKVKKTNNETKDKSTPATPDNEYLQMCQAKRNRNAKFLERVMTDMKTKRKSSSTTPRNSQKNSTSKARAQGSTTPAQKNSAKKVQIGKPMFRNW